MAKLFANLDRLRNSPTPNIVSTAQPIPYEAEATTINTNRPSTISLADRLEQPSLKTTNHLPEFFLSDSYTGFLKIKKFGTYEHTSDIVVKQPIKKIAQGETTVKKITTQPLQGSTNPTFPIASVLLRQGVVESNNKLDSVVTPTQPPAGLNQGAIVINQVLTTPNQGNINITQPNPIVNQGTGTNPNQAISDVRGLQGILVAEGNRSTTGVEKSITTIQNPSGTGINIINPQIKISLPPEDVTNAKEQSTYNPPLVIQSNANIKDTTPSLNVLGYESDRLLARVSPKIKHGSTLETTKAEYYNGILQFNPVTAPIRSYVTDTNADIALPKEPLINVLGNKGDANILDGYIKTPVNNYPKQKGNVESDKAWKVWTYNSDKQSTSTSINSAAELSKVIANSVNKQTQYKNNESTIVITRVGKTDPIIFTAFLTALSDTTTPTFNEYTYVGKQDTFRAYKGTTRQISIGFKAVALGNDTTSNNSLANSFNQSAVDARVLAQKVNRLIQFAGVGEVGNQAYTQGPILKLKIAGLYNDVVVVANSIKVDVPIEDATWDDVNKNTNESTNQGPDHITDRLLPNYYNISMDFAVLSTQEKTLFDINKTYIGY